MSQTTASPPAEKPATPSILDSYVKTAPSDQNAIDIFAGEWASKFPPPFEHIKAGNIPLFQDGRLHWAIERLGGVQGQNVLDLGPLEGGHPFILERSGAGFVTAIEANSRAYLKCLIAKEILNLSRTRFLCGDFVTYLEQTPQQFNTIVASGVLYHMRDPLHLLDLISRHTIRTYIWTHYYDEEIISSKPYLKERYQTRNEAKVGNCTVTEYRHDYLHSLDVKGYTGGSADYSTWLSRDGLMTALKEYGFTDFEFAYEMPDHPHGPCLSLIAVKK